MEQGFGNWLYRFCMKYGTLIVSDQESNEAFMEEADLYTTEIANSLLGLYHLIVAMI